jgi:hypothetical protein
MHSKANARPHRPDTAHPGRYFAFAGSTGATAGAWWWS